MLYEVITDDFVAAWVLRQEGARFVELACTGREVASWVDRLKRPLADAEPVAALSARSQPTWPHFDKSSWLIYFAVQ